MSNIHSRSRTERGVKNAFTTVVMYILALIIAYVARIFFVRYLSMEYLGLNGLFSNVLSFLNLAEMGIGTAMAYALYAPLYQNDTEKIAGIMVLYRKLYCGIGIFVLVVGSLLTPLLPFLIKEIPKDMPLLYVYYLLYIISHSMNYFWSYKRTLIICDEKQYQITSIDTVFRLILSMIQIVLLVMTGSYLFFMIADIVGTVLKNLFISIAADFTYPYLKHQKKIYLPNDIKYQLKKNITALMYHRIGGFIVVSTDNVIISKMVGLAAVGLYSNYVLILTGVNGVLCQLINTLTASIGNMVVQETAEHSRRVFHKILFLDFWMTGMASVCLLCLTEPLITVWLGEEYCLGFTTLAVITANLYFNGMRRAIAVIKDAVGIYQQDRYKALIESVVNLAVSIPLTYRFGIAGTIGGTLISTLAVPLWYEGYVVYKYYFHTDFKGYLIKQFVYSVVTIGIGIATYFACSLIHIAPVLTLGVRLLLSLSIPNLIIWLVFGRSEQYRYLLSLLQKTIRRIQSFCMKSKQ